MVLPDESIDLLDALRAIAVMGDLSMGQPMDHSQRVAALSADMARHLGWDPQTVNQVQQIAWLRWSGCTSNATEIAATISDDVRGRASMLELQLEKIKFLVPPEAIAGQVALASSIHCEVSSLIASTLGLDPAVSDALACVFEHWDGSGSPRALHGAAIPGPALVVAACSELEILSRLHGWPQAMQLLRQRADVAYPAHLVDCMEARAQQWLDSMPLRPAGLADSGLAQSGRQIRMDLIGHVIDLKLPWLLGHSGAVAKLTDDMAAALGLAAPKRTRLRRAAWLHGLGRVSVPNAIWDRPGPLSMGDHERVRLCPYWTSRVGQHVAGLAEAADTAAQAFERLDGSGYFRGLTAVGTPLESRILAAAVAWVAMRADRPWRNALASDAAITELQREASSGRFDEQVIGALVRCVAPSSEARTAKAAATPLLTARELEVLQRVSGGDSNKQAAQRLGISPSTVRTHLESIFNKLDCKTRAACTLRASLLGLLGSASDSN